MTRIVAGAARGRTLVVPRGDATRPTSDRVREALFSRLEHEGVVAGARVLDLFAGSGALGLEAASRGAAHVLLVEQARPALTALRRNVDALGLDGVQVVGSPVERHLAATPLEPYDLVLADPPYPLAEDALATVLGALVEHEWLAEGAVVVVERSARGPEPGWPAGLVRFDERRYGETVLWFAEPLSDPGVA
ncbi:16S rRNA (guanine(966)-N(2))-methyltransferase RsmD [Thalassiella azotivora]